MGWLFATPEGQSDTRAELYGVNLPEMPFAERVHEWWQSLGMAGVGQYGAVPLTWHEVQAFAALMACDIKPFEAECLIEMSRAYCVEIGQKAVFREMPWKGEP